MNHLTKHIILKKVFLFTWGQFPLNSFFFFFEFYTHVCFLRAKNSLKKDFYFQQWQPSLLPTELPVKKQLEKLDKY